SGERRRNAAFLAAVSAKLSMVSWNIGSTPSGLIDVALVAAFATEVGKPGLGGGPVHLAVLGDQEDQRGIDVLGHALGVAADIDVRPALQPRPQPRRVFAHAMLDVDLVRLVAREGEVKPRQ